MLTIVLWVLCPPAIIFLYSGMAVLTFRACRKLAPEPEGDLFVLWCLAALAALGWPIGIPLVSGALFARWLLDRPRMPRARIITRSNRNE